MLVTVKGDSPGVLEDHGEGVSRRDEVEGPNASMPPDERGDPVFVPESGQFNRRGVFPIKDLANYGKAVIHSASTVYDALPAFAQTLANYVPMDFNHFLLIPLCIKYIRENEISQHYRKAPTERPMKIIRGIPAEARLHF